MKKKTGYALIILVLAAIIFLCRYSAERLKDFIMADTEASAVSGRGGVIVLDPGHGGIDDGKTGVNGEKEKEINLKIALKVKNILNERKISVVMTRTTDDRLGSTQTEDLKERVKIINDSGALLSVSIHQNSFEGPDVKGPQVFYYAGSEEGEKAAVIIQEELNGIHLARAREEKADDSYYILKYAEIPAVIAECGFLSNAEEAERLVSDEYQETVALAVADGIIKYIGGVSE